MKTTVVKTCGKQKVSKKINVKRAMWLVITGFFFVNSPISWAQSNNLYFNQVILVGNTTMTVPADKVWKVEGFAQNYYYVSGSSGCGQSYNFHGFYINGTLYGFPYIMTTGTTGLIASTSHFPLWLPAGTTLRTECANDILSVIEFNVAP